MRGSSVAGVIDANGNFNLQAFLSQYWYVLAIFGGIVVLWAVWMVVVNKRNKGKRADYLARHPDAAKVYLTSRALITSEAVQVHLVDGEAPALFNEGGKTGFYVRPGVCAVDVSYTYTRPGVMYRNVTKTTGNVQQQIETEPQGSYLLGFDREEEHFTFEHYLPE